MLAMITSSQFGESIERENSHIYNNAVHALRRLVSQSQKGSKNGKITNSPTGLRTTWDGLLYYFVEVTDLKGTSYLIEAHGKDTMELYVEATNILNTSVSNKSKLIDTI
jgi:hypothetical protein